MMHLWKKSTLFSLGLILLAPFAVSYGDASTTGTPRLMEGPMVGAVSSTEISVWVRASGEFPLALEYDQKADFKSSKRTEKVVPSIEKDDRTAVLRMSGLEADTLYHYRILINDKPAPYIGAFCARTAPAGPARFTVSFGSCPRYQQDPVQNIWKGLEKVAPDLFFWLGDNIYGDTFDPDILAECYRYQRAVPNSRHFLATTPQIAIWDDHDFSLNNHNRTNPIKEASLGVFKRYWANPSYGLPETPGVFFKYHYGGVDFFFLDVRYHRDPNTEPDSPEKTHLGKEQLSWLKEELLASSTPFKVLVSGGGFSNEKGPKGDSWASFLYERNNLFDFIRDREISGVLCFSGDTHVGEFNAIPWSEKGGYDFYDLDSSPLAQKASDNWKQRTPEIRLRMPYQANNAGLVEFDMTAEPPTVRLNLMTETGEPVWDPVVLTSDDLKNGTATAEANIKLD
ncbi:MAG TPA: alkaline phosphatase D family protein [Candidatus Hydrogenedentes bacterium]|nr:alkaline phosphatase D family protein [Candidatus Hydrogenedentota bacterium]